MAEILEPLLKGFPGGTEVIASILAAQWLDFRRVKATGQESAPGAKRMFAVGRAASQLGPRADSEIDLDDGQ